MEPPVTRQLSPRRRKGFSLIDLLVAFTVFSVALMGILTIFPSSMRSIRKARINSVVTHLAQQGLENAYNLAFDSGLAPSANTGSPPSAGPPGKIYTNGGTAGYNYYWLSTVSLTTTINGSQETTDYYVNTTVTVNGASLVDYDVVVYWYDPVATNNASFTITYNTKAIKVNHSYTMESMICDKS